MNKIKWILKIYLLPALITFSILSSIAQEPFICDGDFYLSASLNGGESQFYRIKTEQSTGNVTFEALMNGTGVSLNGVGYRITDNLIYAINPNTFDFYQIDATGSSILLTNLALDSNLGYYGAAITPDGNSMVFVGSGNTGNGFLSQTLVFVDLTDSSYPVTQTLNITGGNIICTDVAFDPFTGIMYGFDSASNRLITFDTQTGAVNTSQYPTTDVAEDIGALFFDSFGNLFGYGNPSGTNLATEFYSLNTNTGVLALESTGPVASGKDGCACPYTIKLQKTVLPEQTFPCTEVVYTFQISNASGQEQMGIDFFDEMPPNLTIVEILNNPLGGIVDGIGTNELSIMDMTVPLGIHDLQVLVYIAEGSDGVYSNQAILSNLPISLGEFTLSDNPKTFEIGDSTELEVLPLFVEIGSDSILICGGESAILDASEHQGLMYEWNTGAMTSSIEITEEGQYAVTVSSACETVFDATFVSTSGLEVSLPNDITIELGDNVDIFPTLQGFGNINYEWTDPLGNSLDCLICFEPNAQPFFDVEYTLTVTNDVNCIDSDNIQIFVDKTREIHIPNVFSPNNDGINDVFFIQSKGTVQIADFKIFDRWGDLVFELSDGLTNDPSFSWDGRFKGERMNPAVFVWFAELIYLDGFVEFQEGDVTLTR